MKPLTRRKLLGTSVPVVGLGGLGLAGLLGRAPAFADNKPEGGIGRKLTPPSPPSNGGHSHHGLHANFVGGTVDHSANGFDPHDTVRDFDWGTIVAGGVRQWDVVIVEKDIEVAPGVTYRAWTFNGRIPGPTFRANEGDRLRINLVNGSSDHPHSMHFHGVHSAQMDGMPGIGAGGSVAPGGSATYEFDATPAGVHLYHCHVSPLAEHIARGLFGAFIIDPKPAREKADELVFVLNGYDTNSDQVNEIYAANGVGFAYQDRSIEVQRNQLVRLYVVNVLEYDLINSFHVHANFFDYFPSGTSRTPSERADTVMFCQGQRGILELRFQYTGNYMFHAHQSRFAELGWQGFFEVR